MVCLWRIHHFYCYVCPRYLVYQDTLAATNEDADLAELNWSLSGSDNKFYALYMRRTPEKRITFLLHRIIMERVLGRSLGDGFARLD